MIARLLKPLAARPAVSSAAVPRAVASLSAANVQHHTNNLDTISKSKRHQWSGTISFAQAESDFSLSDRRRHHLHTAQRPIEWSHTLSYASAQSDFTASDQFASHGTSTAKASNWSGSVTFAAPESDFVSAPTTALGMIHVGEFSSQDGSRLEASPESAKAAPLDFLQAPETALGVVHANEFEANRQDHSSIMLDMSNPIMTAPESATGSVSMYETLDDDLKASLQNLLAGKEALPKTLSEAMQDERPIVVTTAKAPFRVHDVNAAWEGLCGFSRHEAMNQSVGDLLQGPETDNEMAMHLIQHLQQTGFAEGTLTNYKKNGQAFTNRLQLGTVIVDDADDAASDVLFVGILQEIGTQKAASAI